MTRRLDVCADDFGLTLGLSRSIAELAAAGRLASTSCIVTSPHWKASAALLGGFDSGLHFNLSEGAPLSAELARVWPRFPALSSVIASAHLGRLPLDAIAAEWRAQWAAYVAEAGRAPAHVDGHQHVHHLPGVRDVVLAGIADAAPRPGLRNTGRLLGPGHGFKRWVIEHTGGTALARTLARRRWPHGAALVGSYDFEGTDYRSLFNAWLKSVPAEGAQLFCHPGPNEAGDAIGAARSREFTYFAGADYPRDLQAAGITLGRAWIS